MNTTVPVVIISNVSSANGSDALGSSAPLRAQADWVQALVELGQLDDAATVADELERRARAAGGPLFALALAGQARVAAARQDIRHVGALCDRIQSRA